MFVCFLIGNLTSFNQRPKTTKESYASQERPWILPLEVYGILVFVREDSEMLLSTGTGKNAESPTSYLGPFLQISLGSSVTKTYPGKCQHIWHKNAHAHLLRAALQWLCTRQPPGPELVLLQRRGGYWRRNSFKRHLFTFSTPVQLPVLQFPLE